MSAGIAWTKLALLLNQEVSAVVTAMRQNSRWAIIANTYAVRSQHPVAHTWTRVGRTVVVKVADSWYRRCADSCLSWNTTGIILHTSHSL